MLCFLKKLLGIESEKLVEVPPVTNIVIMKPGDVLVAFCNQHLGREQIERLKANLEKIYSALEITPYKIFVIEGGMTLKVFRKEADEHPAYTAVVKESTGK